MWRWLSIYQVTWTPLTAPQMTNRRDHTRGSPYCGIRITDWVRCFGVYIAIVSHQKPKRVPNLLGYQRIIMGASLHCREGKWLTYDHRFRLKASASNTKEWSAIDITIWNTTFPERAIRVYHSQEPPPYQSSLNPPKPIRQNQSFSAQ